MPLLDRWTCHICGRERPGLNISVHTTDVSAEHDMPQGMMTQNVRYCNDSEDCGRRATSYRFVKKERSDG